MIKFPYGLIEAGRQWATVIEDWLMYTMGFEQTKGVSQLFIKRRDDGSIKMLLGTVTHDLHLSGSEETMRTSWHNYHPDLG